MGKPEQDRVQHLLQDTVTLLCKNSLQFKTDMRVQAVIGITLDDETALVVHINERYGPGGVILDASNSKASSKDSNSSTASSDANKNKSTPSTPAKSTTNSAPSTPGSGSKRRRNQSSEVIDLEADVGGKRRATDKIQVEQVQGNFSNYNRMPSSPLARGRGVPAGSPRHGSPSNKPYKCNYPGCDRAFNIADNLKRHQMHNHSGSPQQNPRMPMTWRANSPGNRMPQPGFPGGRGGARRNLMQTTGRGARMNTNVRGQNPVWVNQQGQWRMRPQLAGSQQPPRAQAPVRPQVVGLVPNQATAAANPGMTPQQAAIAQMSQLAASRAIQSPQKTPVTVASDSSNEATNGDGTDNSAPNTPGRTSIDRDSNHSDAESASGRQSVSSQPESQASPRILNIQPLSLGDDAGFGQFDVTASSESSVEPSADTSADTPSITVTSSDVTNTTTVSTAETHTSEQQSAGYQYNTSTQQPYSEATTDANQYNQSQSYDQQQYNQQGSYGDYSSQQQSYGDSSAYNQYGQQQGGQQEHQTSDTGAGGNKEASAGRDNTDSEAPVTPASTSQQNTGHESDTTDSLAQMASMSTQVELKVESTLPTTTRSNNTKHMSMEQAMWSGQGQGDGDGSD